MLLAPLVMSINITNRLITVVLDTTINDIAWVVSVLPGDFGDNLRRIHYAKLDDYDALRRIGDSFATPVKIRPIPHSLLRQLILNRCKVKLPADLEKLHSGYFVVSDSQRELSCVFINPDGVLEQKLISASSEFSLPTLYLAIPKTLTRKFNVEDGEIINRGMEKVLAGI